MLFDPKFTQIERDWNQTIICPVTAVILVVNAVSLFKDFIRTLFDPAFLQAIGVRSVPFAAYEYNILSGIREAIIEAGKVRQLYECDTTIAREILSHILFGTRSRKRGMRRNILWF